MEQAMPEVLNFSPSLNPSFFLSFYFLKFYRMYTGCTVKSLEGLLFSQLLVADIHFKLQESFKICKHLYYCILKFKISIL